MLISSLRVDHQYNSPVRSTMLCASMHGVTERHHISILACTDNCYPFFCWQWRNRNRSASLSWRIILLYILIRIYFFLNRGTRQKNFFLLRCEATVAAFASSKFATATATAWWWWWILWVEGESRWNGRTRDFYEGCGGAVGVIERWWDDPKGNAKAEGINTRSCNGMKVAMGAPWSACMVRHCC